MSRVFVSYRHSGGRTDAMWVRDRLAACLGDKNVYIDDDVEPGSDWWEAIQQGLDRADTLLLLIDRDWLRRERSAPDQVEREVSYFLRDRAATVVPVLLGDAAMPSDNEMPEAIRGVAALHAIRVGGVDRTADFETLQHRLALKCRRAWAPTALAALAIVAIAVVAAIALWPEPQVIEPGAGISRAEGEAGTLLAEGSFGDTHTLEVTESATIEVVFRQAQWQCDAAVTLVMSGPQQTLVYDLERCAAVPVDLFVETAGDYRLSVASDETAGAYVFAVTAEAADGPIARTTTSPTPSPTRPTSAPVPRTDGPILTAVDGMTEISGGFEVVLAATGEVGGDLAPHVFSLREGPAAILAEFTQASWPCGAPVVWRVTDANDPGVVFHHKQLHNCLTSPVPGFFDIQQAGDYAVSVSSDPGVAGRYRILITALEPFPGSVRPGEPTRHPLVIDEPQRIFVDIRSVTCRAGTSWWTWNLLGPEVRETGLDLPCNPSGDAGSFGLPSLQPGTYTLEVAGDADYVFQVWLARDARTTILPSEHRVQGAIGAGATHSYEFDVASRTRLQLVAQMDACRGFPVVTWRFAGPGLDASPQMQGCVALRFTTDELAAGRYTMTVDGAAATHGNYEFRLCENTCE